MLVPPRMFIDVRLTPPAAKTYPNRVRWSILSIFSLALLFTSSVYFYRQLINPCVTYKLLTEPHDCHNLRFACCDDSSTQAASASLGEKVVCFLSNLAYPTQSTHEHTVCLNSIKPSLGEQLVCLFPSVTYPKPAIKACNNRSTKNKYLNWSVGIFLWGGAGALVGILFETYLLLRMSPFEFDVTPFTASIVNIRFWIYAFVYCCTMLTTVGLTVDPGKIPKDLPQLYLSFSHSAVFLMGALSVTLYFNNESYLPFVLGIGMVSQLMWIFFQGTVSGGVLATRFLWFGVFAHLLGSALFEPTTPRASTIYHICASIASSSIYVALTLSGNANQEHTSKVAEALFPDGLYTLSLVLSYVFGIIFALRISPKTYQAWRSMMSCIIWSVIYFVILAEPTMLLNPFRLSDVYGSMPLNRLTVQPYSEQHSTHMPKALGIPSIKG
jgi:hypothetical protein